MPSTRMERPPWPSTRAARALGIGPTGGTLVTADLNRVSLVQDILRRWDPIGIAPGEFGPADEYDGYAPHIVSMAVRGCSPEELRQHLEGIQVEMMGIEANPDRDRQIADEILAAIREAV